MTGSREAHTSCQMERAPPQAGTEAGDSQTDCTGGEHGDHGDRCDSPSPAGPASRPRGREVGVGCVGVWPSPATPVQAVRDLLLWPPLTPGGCRLWCRAAHGPDSWIRAHPHTAQVGSGLCGQGLQCSGSLHTPTPTRGGLRCITKFGDPDFTPLAGQLAVRTVDSGGSGKATARSLASRPVHPSSPFPAACSVEHAPHWGRFPTP